ncbi:hypothetical protein [Nocardia sp. R7R-8]|uniref:hypothetical protein n=1 Tax=Nocardia sp. R7R-8 TaxID=3459304 RepID=UPI00403D622B
MSPATTWFGEPSAESYTGCDLELGESLACARVGLETEREMVGGGARDVELVGGQEDFIVDIALDLAAGSALPPLRELQRLRSISIRF